MAERREIRVPDIGDFEEVEVVEILAKAGDRIAIDDPLVSIESEKATMEIPSPAAGTLIELSVKEGDRVSQGSLLAVLEVSDAATGERAPTGRKAVAAEKAVTVEGAKKRSTAEQRAQPAPAKEGAISASPSAGTTAAVSDSTQSSKTGDEPERVVPRENAPSPATRREFESIELDQPVRELSTAAANPVPDRTDVPHASPLVRRFARELGVPVGEAQPSGPNGRVLIDDVKRHVREQFGAGSSGESAGKGAGMAIPGSSGLPSVAFVDPGRFGPVHEQPLTRIQKVSGPALHRSWLGIPHVTQHDEADITELERFRRDRKQLAASKGVKLSPLLFVMKAVVIALREFPTLRSTLAPERDRLLVKDYFHLGIAVDTEQGLVVPVVRDVDRKGVIELAAELQATAERARNRKLTPDDLAGACFTISSLGGIGGTAFSPIVNGPEVAILGLSKTQVKPVWQGPSPLDRPAVGSPAQGGFEPRLFLPLSLSYDHRVVDGAMAVRFTTRLAAVLADPMQLLL